MLLRNLFLVLFFIGMVFSIPIDEENKDVNNLDTDLGDDIVEQFIDATENDEVEVDPFKEDPFKAEEEKVAGEQKEQPEAEEKTDNVEDEPVQTDVVEEKPTPTDNVREVPAPTDVTPFIPENEEIAVKYEDSCTKDHILLGNHVPSDVCNDLYKACTTKELLAVIVYYYTKQAPVSIEYTINEGINKESISEGCGNVLVNSKIFQQETVIIPPVDEIEVEPAEKIKKLTQDLPKEDIENIKREEQNREGDEFAEYSEDHIED